MGEVTSPYVKEGEREGRKEKEQDFFPQKILQPTCRSTTEAHGFFRGGGEGEARGALIRSGESFTVKIPLN